MRDHTVGLSCSKAQFSQHCIDIKTKQKRDQAKKYFSYFDRPKSFINDGDDAEECSLCSFIFIFYFFFTGGDNNRTSVLRRKLGLNNGQ